MFNRKKKQIEELQEKLNTMVKKIIDLEKENKNLKKKLNENRVCDGYCELCKHFFVESWNIGRKQYGCLLDCKCPDFKKKVEE